MTERKKTKPKPDERFTVDIGDFIFEGENVPAGLNTERKSHIPPRMGLSAVRKQRHLTQVEIAERLGTTQDLISKLEGRTDSKLTTVLDFLEATGASNVEINIDYPDGEHITLPLNDQRAPRNSAPRTGRPRLEKTSKRPAKKRPAKKRAV